MPFANKTTVRFTSSFTSPSLGNVWEGREVTLSHKQARRFVELGYAVDLSAKKKPAAKQPKKTTKQETKDGGSDNAGGSEASSKGNK
jgi:hypothetical protein